MNKKHILIQVHVFIQLDNTRPFIYILIVLSIASYSSKSGEEAVPFENTFNLKIHEETFHSFGNYVILDITI